MKRFAARLIGLGLAALVVARCGTSDSVVVTIDDEPDTLLISVDGSTITTSVLELQVGQTAQLSASALSEVGLVVGGVTIEWSSTAPEVASVDSNGLVEALSAGNTNITASAAGITAVMPTHVTDAPQGSLGRLLLSPSSVTITGIGTTTQLFLTAEDASGAPISSAGTTWGSGNASIASVSGSGLVTAQGVGVTEIFAHNPCCRGDTVVVSVRLPSSGSVNLDFYSDWSNGTGQTVQAIGDGGRWSAVLPLDGISDVVSGAAYGWSLTQNVLRNTDTGTGQDGGAVFYTNYFPTRTSFYMRFWFYISDAQRGINHTPSFPQAGALVWGWQYKSGGGGIEVGSGYGPSRDGNTEYRTRTGSYPLDPGTWYRFECFVEFAPDSAGYARFRNHPRIYNMAGTLLYDDDDFTNEATGESLAEVYAMGLWATSSIAAANAASGFFLGNGEATFSGGGTNTRLIYAAPALSTEDWIGDYIP